MDIWINIAHWGLILNQLRCRSILQQYLPSAEDAVRGNRGRSENANRE
jgi:hypothetical protein